MRVLVCGGRDFYDTDYVFKALEAFHERFRITVLIHGDAAGADLLAKQWAGSWHYGHIKVLPFPADWELYGKRAGPVRNRKMLREGKPDIVIAFPGGRGTRDMVLAAGETGVRVLNLARKYKEWKARQPAPPQNREI